MRKRGNRKIVLQGFILLTVMLSACGKSEPEAVPEKAFGVDYLQEQEMRQPVQVVCDSDSAWVITAVKDEPIRRYSMGNAGAEPEQIPWQSEAECYELISIAQRQGTLYAEVRNRENDALEILRWDAGGTWSAIMSIRVENWEDYTVMGNVFYVDGSENVYLVSGNEVMRFEGEGQRADAYQLKGRVCSFWEPGEGRVECVTAEETGILLYELKEGGAEEKWMLKQSEAVGTLYVIGGSKENLYLAADGEILFLDGATGSPAARVDLVKLGVSSVSAGYYDENEGTLRLLGIIENGEGLRYSLLSERDEDGEQRTEIVYGMESGVNNGESSSIGRAISEFNQTSPDYYVTIKNYDNNIERMLADMGAGKGPDIIDMTHSEYYESYAKNGYLEDLTPYLEQSQYKDDIIWNILDAYRIDGKLYLLPPQVQLKGVMINPEYEIPLEEWSRETFLELVNQNKWEKPLLAGQNKDPEALLLFLLSADKDGFVDWGQSKASFETQEFVNMLELCKRYAEADGSGAAGWTDEEKEQNALFREVQYGGGFYGYLLYGREYPVYGYPAAFGQAYKLIPCSDSCAIYAGSDQKEGAWAFLESLLQESNQKYSGIANPGFPIRSSVLDELAEESKHMEIKVDGEMLTITDDEIQILMDIFHNGKLCSGMLNTDILSIIMEEAGAYFAGDKDVWDVAHIIQSRVQIVLQE